MFGGSDGDSDPKGSWAERSKNRPLSSNEVAPGLSVLGAGPHVSKGYRPITSPSTGSSLEQITEKCLLVAKTIDRLKAAMADKLEQINSRRHRFVQAGYTAHLGTDGFRFERRGTQITIWHARGVHEGVPYITDIIRPELAEYADAVLRHLSPVESTTDAAVKAAHELNSAATTHTIEQNNKD
ncbi:MAG: hypothetical protein AB7U75_19905 [Hyphomicrobiaceae bacterium]